jgi:succinate dehydrogenase/fumarate reductase cytochrome b subunit
MVDRRKSVNHLLQNDAFSWQIIVLSQAYGNEGKRGINAGKCLTKIASLSLTIDVIFHILITLRAVNSGW